MVTVFSFGMKHGGPPVGSRVYYALNLPNPYNLSRLKPLRGTDPKVRSWLMASKPAQKLVDQIVAD